MGVMAVRLARTCDEVKPRAGGSTSGPLPQVSAMGLELLERPFPSLRIVASREIHIRVIPAFPRVNTLWAGTRRGFSLTRLDCAEL